MDSAELYLASVRKVLDEINLEQIAQAAELIAAALRHNGIIQVFGAGHSSLLAQEIFFRAGGLVAVNPMLSSSLSFEGGVVESTEFERRAESAEELIRAADFHQNDVGIVISNSGRNALPVEIAVRMKAVGMKVIALTNPAQSRQSNSHHSSGKRLFEIADVVLDNHCPPGDAAVSIKGITAALGAVSTIAGAALLHATLLQAAELLSREGKPPDAFVSVNLGSGSTDTLKTLIARYQRRIRYYRPNGGAH
ncbi:MAG TPA: sugar isomerase domain-containing protein [Terriglobales bacterium]|nr:sugar isomerase domain-containing protein [Terriglobales bacterium]